MAQNRLRIAMRKIHKWTFIFMGLFMLLWVASGIIISVPMHWLDIDGRPTSHSVDYSQAVVSPAQAAAKVAADGNSPARITSVSTQQIQDTLVYLVKREGEGERAVNAVTGEYFEFSPALAESIVRERYGIEDELIENRVLTAHNFGYPWGPLPVSHLRFSGQYAGADFYVNHTSGNVRSGTALTRARVAGGMIHSLEPIKHFTGSERLHRGFLVLTAAISLLGVIAGLYLVLPRRS